eukprot:SAG11_NODE_1155_length_5660_cov_6.290955_3_plen_93_part_00
MVLGCGAAIGGLSFGMVVPVRSASSLILQCWDLEHECAYIRIWVQWHECDQVLPELAQQWAGGDTDAEPAGMTALGLIGPILRLHVVGSRNP